MGEPFASACTRLKDMLDDAVKPLSDQLFQAYLTETVLVLALFMGDVCPFKGYRTVKTRQITRTAQGNKIRKISELPCLVKGGIYIVIKLMESV
jgi:hypothetical protein